MDPQAHCQRCDPSCALCRGPRPEDCTKCPVSKIFDAGRCVFNCPLGKFNFNNECHPCHNTCQECQGNGPYNCTACGIGKHGQEHFLDQGKCRDRCPAGHFPGEGHICLPCPENCELCQSIKSCTQCRSGYFIEPTNHTCQKSECGKGEVQDPDYEGCIPCEEGCLGCSLGDPGTCTSCATGYYMFESRCYQVCPEKTYSEGLKCHSCDPNCISCEQNACYWCEEGFFLLDGQCVSECGLGFFRDSETGECVACHDTCDTCIDQGPSACSSCQLGLHLWFGTCVHPTQIQDHGTFWNAVPTTSTSLVRNLLQKRRRRKFPMKRDVLGELQPCHPSCKTCNGSAILCTSCPKGTYLQAQACVSSCPQGMWPSKKSGSCEDCTEGCASCSEANICKKCQTQPDHRLVLHKGKCYSKCPGGFYAEDGTCEKCSSSCKTCEGNATNCQSCAENLVLNQGVCQKTCPEKHVDMEGICKPCPEMCEDCIHEKTCKECMPGTFLLEHKCHKSCPSGFYEEDRQCVLCHEDCLECSGPSAEDCDLCAHQTSFLYNGQCFQTCPAGTYNEKRTKNCTDCPKSCKTCSSPNTCIDCQEGLMRSSDGNCVPHRECAPSEYWTETLGCQPCHETCFHCSGLKPDQCHSCWKGDLLLNTTCVKVCPESYYKDSNQCIPCHSSCKTCKGRRSKQCLSCQPGLFQLGEECLLQCREGYYAESSTGLCKRCNKSCKGCRGPKPTDCLSCDPFFFLLQAKGECHHTCPDHYHAEQRTQTCVRCHPTCNKCKGKGDLNCVSCVWSYHLMGGSCTSDCLVGEYRVGEEEEFNCEKCHESCVECKGPGANNCTVCPANLLLHLDSNRCLHCCNTSDPTESHECCDCQKTMDECILQEREIGQTAEHLKTTLFITSSVMLVLLLLAAVLVRRRSRARAQAAEKAGYAKLSDPTRSYSSKSSHLQSICFEEDQVIEYRDRDSDEDDDDDDDIVYMSQDGTVYRKFKYGLLDDDDEDQLEYDDESYSFH